MEDKLFQQKVFKINGIRFAIRKLSPSLFLDKDYLLPIASVVKKTNSSDQKISEREMKKATEEFKIKMRDAIVRSVVYVKSNLLAKKQSIDILIESIMDNPELYSYLFTIIVNHSLGIKKNYSRLFSLTKVSLEPSI